MLVRRFSTAVVCAAVVLAACGSSSKSPARGTLSGTLLVSAAASLNKAFTQIGKDFEVAHPGTTVRFNFDASSALVTQITSGAPADVFASADATNMDKLSTAKLLRGAPQNFARNQLEIATKPSNPKHIKGLTDLASVGVIALCAEEVPCGKYAAQVLDQAKVSIPESSITRGQNATTTLGMVSQGDANAAIVYVTDVKGAGNAVAGIGIPANENAIATYPIAALKDASNTALAQAFVDYVLSTAGQHTLQSFAFMAP
ncbi:MAG TPA: molybdate ABC transporter substrate-binding protein [Acidimicrobiia bacterium]|nr:molybdate ABC transporter substrate-binding protein [Acidimicrobiia bacterium]